MRATFGKKLITALKKEVPVQPLAIGYLDADSSDTYFIYATKRINSSLNLIESDMTGTVFPPANKRD